MRSFPGAKRSSPAAERTSARAVLARDHELHPVGLEQRVGRAPYQLVAAPVVEGVDHRGPRRGTGRELRLGGRGVARAEHAHVRQHVGQVDPRLDGGLRVVRHHDHRVLLEERLGSARHVHDPLEGAVGLRDRAHLAVRADLVRVRVVVGQREQEEVEEVVLDQIGAHAARVPVALAGHPERGRAAGVARVEQVGVEQLACAVHRVAELRRLGDPPVHAGAGRVVPRAAAVDQVGRAGGPQPRVVQVLEHGLVRTREVRQVHVVDRVVEGAHDPEGARGGQRRAVLHVALLAAVEPVHRGDVVLAGPAAGGDRRRRDGRDRWESRHAVADVRAAVEQRRERRRVALGDGLVEHVRLQRIDDREDELLRHYRRILSPAYFSPSRLRPPASSTMKPGMARSASGGTKSAIAARISAAASA